MFSLAGSEFLTWLMKRLARTTSRVVTPKRRLGLYTPRALKTSAVIGTVEFTCQVLNMLIPEMWIGFTGFAMMQMLASGLCSAQAFAKSRTIEALVLKRSCNV